MKRKLTVFSERYLAALREHVQSRHVDPDRARSMGRQAVELGLDTLEMARVHQAALERLGSRLTSESHAERAGLFFVEALSPIEETHGAALEARTRLNRLHRRLGKQTAALAESNRWLREGIARRKKTEKALKQSGANFRNLLKQSRYLQQSLRALARGLVAAQENNRRTISQQLMNEVAHSLLGVNLGLVAAKQAASLNDQQLQKEISLTRRLVVRSVKSIEGFAREHCQWKS